MSTIVIKYDRLESAASQAKFLSKRLDSYGSGIGTKVTDKFCGLSGSDDEGFISTASAKASNKITALAQKSGNANTFGDRLATFVCNAKAADLNVKSEINKTGKESVGKRKWYQKIGDWAYNTFCVDLANSNPVTKLIADCIGWGTTKVGNLVESVHDWFKYKGGKYVWNGILAVAGAIAAVAAAVVAVCTAGTVLAVIAAVAACVIAVIAIVNAGFSVVSNIKAGNKYREGQFGQARYQGGIEGFSSYVERTDMGSEEENAKWKLWGKVVDTTETVCQIIVAVNAIANFAGVKNPENGKVEHYEFSKKNITKNIKESLGITRGRKSVDPDTGKLIEYQGEKSGYRVTESWSLDDALDSRSDGTKKQYLKKYFGFGKTDKYFYSKENGFSINSQLSLSKKFNRLSTGQKIAKTVLDGGSVVSKTMGKMTKMESVYEDMKNGTVFEDAYGFIKNINKLSPFKSGGDIGNFFDIVDAFVDGDSSFFAIWGNS